jgi:hypothetical protein
MTNLYVSRDGDPIGERLASVAQEQNILLIDVRSVRRKPGRRHFR